MDKQTKRLFLSLAEAASVFAILAGIAVALLIYVLLVYVLVIYLKVRFSLQGTAWVIVLFVVMGAAFMLWQLKGLAWTKKGFGLLPRVGSYFDAKKAALDKAPESKPRS